MTDSRDLPTRLRALANRFSAQANGYDKGAAQGWRPIDTAPRDGTRVIIARHVPPWGWVRAVGYYADDFGIAGWVPLSAFAEPPGVLGLAEPSHWQPAPPGPMPSIQDAQNARRDAALINEAADVAGRGRG